MERTYISKQVYDIAEKYGLFQSQVHDIIKTYIYNCKLALMRGEVVDMYGFVRIVPDVITTSFEQTRGFFCYKTADALGLPHNTVIAVITAYIKDAVSDLLGGKSVEFRGLFTCKPLITSEGTYTINTHISQSLRGMLPDFDTPVTGFRVKTYKTLRERIKNESTVKYDSKYMGQSSELQEVSEEAV